MLGKFRHLLTHHVKLSFTLVSDALDLDLCIDLFTVLTNAWVDDWLNSIRLHADPKPVNDFFALTVKFFSLIRHNSLELFADMIIDMIENFFLGINFHQWWLLQMNSINSFWRFISEYIHEFLFLRMSWLRLMKWFEKLDWICLWWVLIEEMSKGYEMSN